MNAKDRDDIIAKATAILSEHGPDCPCVQGQLARAVMEYVPPATAEFPPGYRVELVSRSLPPIYAQKHGPILLDVRDPQGRSGIGLVNVQTMRQVGMSLVAAADGAVES